MIALVVFWKLQNFGKHHGIVFHIILLSVRTVTAKWINRCGEPSPAGAFPMKSGACTHTCRGSMHFDHPSFSSGDECICSATIDRLKIIDTAAPTLKIDIDLALAATCPPSSIRRVK